MGVDDDTPIMVSNHTICAFEDKGCAHERCDFLRPLPLALLSLLEVMPTAQGFAYMRCQDKCKVSFLSREPCHQGGVEHARIEDKGRRIWRPLAFCVEAVDGRA